MDKHTELQAKIYDMLEYYLLNYDFSSKEDVLFLIDKDLLPNKDEDYLGVKAGLKNRVMDLSYAEILELKKIFNLVN